jgi:polyhydroxybutyrate depolymerase
MNRDLVQAIVGVALAVTWGGCGGNEPAPSDGGNGGNGGTTSAAGTASTGGSLPAMGGSLGGSTAAGTSTGGGASSAGGTGGSMGGDSAGHAGASSVAGTGGSNSSGGEVMKSAGCGVTDHPASGTLTIDVAGTEREYILELPDGYDANTPYKLVFGWHWRGGNAGNVAMGQLGGGPYYGLKARAKGSTIFVAPNGIDNGWANTGGRDIAFLKAMLALFEAKLCIDQSRIFSTGFSYGGMMSDAIGCDMADTFRAIAPMSGALYSGCTKTGSQPIAVWLSHGSSDDVVPLADGKAALDIFLQRNGCGSQTSPVTPSPCVAYAGCSAGHPVHYCEFDGGHQPPSFASSAIWEFFSQF